METLLTAPDGRVVGINQKMLNFMPFTLVTNQPNLIVTVPTGTTSPSIAMTVSGEGPAQIVSFAKQASAAAKVKLHIQEGSDIRPLMNGAVHIDTLFGGGNTPYPLPEALYVDELRRLMVEIQNISVSSVAVRLAAACFRATSLEADPTLMLGRKRQGVRQFLSTPYWYTLDDGPITLTTTDIAEYTITIGPDHHFHLMQLMASSDASFDINLLDLNTGESLVQTPLADTNLLASEVLFGTANYPICLMSPRLFQTGQKILVRIRNRDVGANVIYLTLGGRALADKMWR